MDMKIEFGTEIRTNLHFNQVYNITRIEFNAIGGVSIYACENSWFNKFRNDKNKLFERDELILQYGKPIKNKL